MNTIGLLGLLAGIAVASALLLANYQFSLFQKKDLRCRLLFFLFIAIAIRIAKSIWFFILYGVAPLGIAIGFVGLSTIGPLLMIYMRENNVEKPKLITLDIFHFLIPLIGFVVIPLNKMSFATLAYRSGTALLFIYIVVAVIQHRKNNYPDKKIAHWNSNLMLSVALIWAAFVYQHLSETLLHYAIGAGLASVPVYFLLSKTLGQQQLFKNAIIKKKIDKDQLNLVQKALEIEKVYRKKHQSLKQFSEEVGLPTYLVSAIIQELYGASFPETINKFRIKELQRLLLNPEYEIIKIEGLAYDVGFNSPSAFYAAFKKVSGMTPKQYQREYYK